MCPQWMTWWDTGTPRVTGQTHSGLGGAAHFVMVGVSHAVVSPFRPIQLSWAEGWTALSPFSNLYLRKGEFHSWEGSA